MYAILQHGGHQYRVSPGDRLVIDRLTAEVGDVVALEPVLTVSDGADTTVGTPVVTGARVAAVVVGHTQGRKLRVFKYKAKKRFRRTHGHRSQLTELRIEAVLAQGEALPKAPPARARKVEAVEKPEKAEKAAKQQPAVAEATATGKPAAKAARAPKAAATTAAVEAPAPEKAPAKKRTTAAAPAPATEEAAAAAPKPKRVARAPKPTAGESEATEAETDAKTDTDA